MHLEEYARHDAVGLADLVHRGEVKPSELMELALAGIEATSALNAVVEVYDDALDRARALADQPGPLADRPFAGVPTLRKDIGAPEAGKRTELGSRLAEGLQTHRDSYLVSAMKESGLVILGRSTTSEMGCYGTVESAATGITANPWAPGVTSGGSSGGSSALVAAGVVPLAHANDGAGSIRIPASCCGLVGLKPSRGRVSAGPGAGEPNFGGSVQLVVTRTVRDAATALDALGGPRPGDPFTIPQPGAPFARLAERPPAPLRIGVVTDPWAAPSVAPDVVDVARATAATLAGIGHHVEETSFPFDAEIFLRAFVDLWAIGVAGPIPAVAERMHRPLTDEFLEPVTLAWLERCEALCATDISHALDDVNRMARRAGDFFGRHDVLLTPTLAQPPVPHGTIDGRRAGVDAAANTDAMLAFNPYCPLFNLTGQPAITLPLGSSAEGLPIGVQLVAPHAQEGLLLSLAAQLEAATPWAGRIPPVHVSRTPR